MIATIIISIIAILLRKVNQIELQKIQKLAKSQNDMEVETITIAESSRQSTLFESIEPVIVSKMMESTRVCEPIGHTSHVIERPKIRIFTIFGSTKQSFDLNCV